ncbi:cellulase family glycosylhydrolase [Vallitalea guaymasensis]|uniref:cellulase family glycosylhydrolase n=1 Tax=Vallitalea guaymasensis TaxID=1185412 RepID=UPI000DE231C4|nr:cellulase family glycosylhydrolase [Vallitalea guaymasensis]
MEKIHVKGKCFIDNYNRERIFNGINMVYKGNYDESSGKKNYITDWNENHFKWLVDNGFNIIRLGIIWDGVEHEMGIYDEKYLDWIGGILDLCEQYDIYAFLDMHQDLYSNKFSDGAPDWATITDNQEHVKGDLWSDAYIFSGAVKRSFENFWANTKAPDGIGLQDHYANMWAHIVKRFENNKALIGYDFINEPFPGESSLRIFGTLLGAYAEITQQDISPEELMASFTDVEQKNKLLRDIDNVELYTAMAKSAMPLVSEFDKGALAYFYKKITGAVREASDKGIVMMENSYFSNMGIECNIPLITDSHGIEEKNQAYAPHGYDLVVDTPEVIHASNNRIDTILNAHKRVQERLNIPVLFGEWGAHSMYSEGMYHIIHILDTFDKYKWSNTYWCYHEYIEKAPVMDILKRPYPQAVCGEIIAYSYNRENDVFTLDWQEHNDIKANTEIYLPHEPVSIDIDSEFTIIRISDTSEAVKLSIPNKSMTVRKLTVVL